MNITRYDDYDFETFYGDVYGNNYDELSYSSPKELGIDTYSSQDSDWNYYWN